MFRMRWGGEDEEFYWEVQERYEQAQRAQKEWARYCQDSRTAHKDTYF